MSSDLWEDLDTGETYTDWGNSKTQKNKKKNYSRIKDIDFMDLGGGTVMDIDTAELAVEF